MRWLQLEVKKDSLLITGLIRSQLEEELWSLEAPMVGRTWR